MSSLTDLKNTLLSSNARKLNNDPSHLISGSSLVHANSFIVGGGGTVGGVGDALSHENNRHS